MVPCGTVPRVTLDGSGCRVASGRGTIGLSGGFRFEPAPKSECREPTRTRAGVGPALQIESEGRIKTAQNEAPRVLVALRGGGRFIGDSCWGSNGMSRIDPSPVVGQSSPASAPGRSRKLKHDPALLREEAIRAARYVPPGHPGVWSPGPASGPIRDGEDLRSLPPVSNTGGKSLGPITEPPSLGALFLLPRRDPAHDRKDKDGAVLVERWRVWSVK